MTQVFPNKSKQLSINLSQYQRGTYILHFNNIEKNEKLALPLFKM